MSRTNALSIVTSADVAEKLSESYGQVIENIQKGAVSEQIKNKNYSGDPLSGSVEFKRFVNSEVDDYGTARTAGNGKAIKADPITVNITDDKEIVEEVEQKDVKLYGVDGLVDRRKGDHAQRLIAYLDRQFFAALDAAATAITVTATEIEDQLEEVIQHLETVENDYVDGVPRDIIVVTLKPIVYGKLRNFIDKVTVFGINGSEELVNKFHGVRVLSNARQANDALIMVEGAAAQPVVVDEYDAERIPLSNAIAIELFASKGTKVLTPDLVFKADLTA